MPQTRSTLLFLIVLVPAFHLLQHALGVYDLTFDEAQYWLWGKMPDWGYYSKPPVIGWLMALSTAMFGDDIFGVKMLAPLLHLATAWVLYQTSLHLHASRHTALWVSVSYITIPAVTIGSTFLSTDTPLLLCWTVALYALLRMLDDPKSWRWWLLLGAAVGVGMMSKYTMLLFGLGVGLTVLFHNAHRHILLTPYPYVAIGLALLLFIPNILWNLDNDFATIGHTQDNVLSKQLHLYPVDMLEFVAAQWGVFGPILCSLLCFLAIKPDRTAAGASILPYFIWPPILIGIVVSLIAGAQAHWVAPAYVAGLLLVIPWMIAHAPKLLKLSLILHVVVIVGWYALPAIAEHLPRDPLKRLYVWNELALHVEKWQQLYPDAIIVADERKIAAALTYKLRNAEGQLHIIYKWNPTGAVRDHYDILTKKISLKGKDLILVSRQQVAALKNIAPSAEILQTIPLGRRYQFHVVHIKQFDGFQYHYMMQPVNPFSTWPRVFDMLHFILYIMRI